MTGKVDRQRLQEPVSLWGRPVWGFTFWATLGLHSLFVQLGVEGVDLKWPSHGHFESFRCGRDISIWPLPRGRVEVSGYKFSITGRENTTPSSLNPAPFESDIPSPKPENTHDCQPTEARSPPTQEQLQSQRDREKRHWDRLRRVQREMLRPRCT